MTTIITNFSLVDVNNDVLIAVPASARIPLNPDKGDDLILVNDSNATIFVRTGDASVVADIGAMPILSGEKGTYFIGKKQGRVTHIAGWVPNSTADLIVVQGTGL